MKKIYTISGLLVAMGSAAHATIVSASNFPELDGTIVPILDNTGTAIATGAGFASVGTFATVPTTVEDISTFVAFGTGGTTFENELLGAGTPLDGFFNIARSEPIAFGSTDFPVGQDIYIVIGDGTTLANSTQFAVILSGQEFLADPQVGTTDIPIGIDDAFLTAENLLIGSIVEDVDLEVGFTFNEGIQLTDGTAVVPEPSTGLLAGLAGLALLARRRR